ncbi:hypothetical protein ADUPG1_005067, partial [Aduncisulcus paluster]
GEFTVIYPADELNPAGESSAPWIVLNPESGSGGLEAENLRGAIGLDVGVREKDPKIGVKQVWQFYAKVIDTHPAALQQARGYQGSVLLMFEESYRSLPENPAAIKLPVISSSLDGGR